MPEKKIPDKKPTVEKHSPEKHGGIFAKIKDLAMETVPDENDTATPAPAAMPVETAEETKPEQSKSEESQPEAAVNDKIVKAILDRLEEKSQAYATFLAAMETAKESGLPESQAIHMTLKMLSKTGTVTEEQVKDSINEMIRGLRGEQDTFKQTLEDQRSQVVGMTSDCEAMKKEIDSLQNKIEGLKKKKEQAERKVTTARAELVTREQEFTSAIGKIESDLRSMLEKISK